MQYAKAEEKHESTKRRKLERSTPLSFFVVSYFRAFVFLLQLREQATE